MTDDVHAHPVDQPLYGRTADAIRDQLREHPAPVGALSRMTLRVSTDGGRSYGIAVTEAVDHDTAWENAGPLGLGPGPWPPCQCPRHRGAGLPGPRG
ncbi:hypothetical protein GCM10010310_79030 [Streptomyces violaceolatus]|uniref:Uncharacterized protein n=1 Tax=Streptomyces violaceolatus TaxID=67378 RepID=A0ABN3TH20_9ACTN